MRYVTKIASVLTVATAVLVGAGSAVLLQSQPANAQSAPAGGAFTIGVIDNNAILALSTAGKGLQTAADQRLKQLDDDAGKKRDSLQKQAQLLEQQRATMTPQDFQTKREAIQKQAEQAQTDYQTKRRALQQSANQALDQIRQQTILLIKQVATQKNLSVVMLKDAIAWAPNAVDITPDIITALNQKMPSIKLP